jgi:hypothetical protein
MSETPRQKKLEARWWRSQKKRKADGRPKAMLGFERPQGLRGPALVEYLVLLSSYWRDKRFADCISALLEHGIVEPDTHKFTNAKSPEIDRYNQQQDVECLAQVRHRIRTGESKNRACEEVAADRGFGNSFDAAVKHLKDLLEQSRKGRPRRSRLAK